MEEILHQLIGSLPYYLQGFIRPRWCRISSINSMSNVQMCCCASSFKKKNHCRSFSNSIHGRCESSKSWNSTSVSLKMHQPNILSFTIIHQQKHPKIELRSSLFRKTYLPFGSSLFKKHIYHLQKWSTFPISIINTNQQIPNQHSQPITSFSKYRPNQPTNASITQDTQTSAAWSRDRSVCPTSRGGFGGAAERRGAPVVVDGGILMLELLHHLRLVVEIPWLTGFFYIQKVVVSLGISEPSTVSCDHS